jgi:branched-chain amino acid transport system substrate-binding protein
MRKRSLVALACIVVLASLGVAESQAPQPLKLPFPYIFTGPGADWGERVWKEGIGPAVEVVNKKGGIKGRPLEFYKVDTRFPETAPWVTEFRRLAGDASIPIIYGVGPTKSQLAIAELIDEMKIPVFNPSSAGSWPLPSFGKYTFRYQPIADTAVPVMLAKVKQKLPLKTAALVYANDDEAMVNNAKIMRKALQAADVKIVTEQTYRTKETNFTSQVSAIKAAAPDAIVASSQAFDAGTLALQIRERGLTQPIIGDVSILADDYWKLSRGKGEGTIAYSIYNPLDPRPIVQEWVKLWRTKMNKPDAFPDSFVTTYYDATMVLAHVLNTAKDLSRDGIRDSFLAVRNMETISGKVSWEQPGDVVRSEIVLVQWKDGKLVPWP